MLFRSQCAVPAERLIDYQQYTLLNAQAACNVWQDARATREQISKVAGSLKLCAHPRLKSMGTTSIISCGIAASCFTGQKAQMLMRMPYTTSFRIMKNSSYTSTNNPAFFRAGRNAR